MKSITIIGLGWLGLPLAEHLQQQGFQVCGTKRDVSNCTVSATALDFNAFAITPELETQLTCDALVINVPPNTTSAEQYQFAVKALVKKAILQGAKQVIFIGSTSVLPMESGEFDENSPTDPSNPQIQLENWLLAQPIHCDILRLGGLIGKSRHPVYYLAGKQKLTGANQLVNLVHLEDCIRAIQALLEKPNGQRIFHLCSPKHPTRQAFYSKIAKQLGLPNLHFLPDDKPLVRIIKAEKICQELGFYYRYHDPYLFEIENRSKKT